MKFALSVLLILSISLAAPDVSAIADETSPAAAAGKSPIIAHQTDLFSGVKAILIRSAEQMPEELYGYRPTAAVRSYGEIVGHVADSQYWFCSPILGQKDPALKIEKTKTSKSDLIAALKEAFAYCDRAYQLMNDTSAIEPVRFFGGDKPKLGLLTVNSVHTIEHYGNLVTYMRMNDIVPPTSEPAFMKQLQKK